MKQSELRLLGMESGLRRWRFWAQVLFAAGLFCAGAPLAATAQGSPEDAGKSAATATASTNAVAIPMAEVAAQAEAAFASLQSIEGNLSADDATLAIQQDLPVLTTVPWKAMT